MLNSITPTKARQHLYEIIKAVNSKKKPITITPADGNEDQAAVIISKKDFDAILETLFLENNGTMNLVRKREKDNSGTTNIDDIDWDKL